MRSPSNTPLRPSASPSRSNRGSTDWQMLNDASGNTETGTQELPISTYWQAPFVPVSQTNRRVTDAWNIEQVGQQNGHHPSANRSGASSYHSDPNVSSIISGPTLPLSASSSTATASTARSRHSGRTPRPPNAWILYRSEQVRALREREGVTGRCQSELSKLIGSMWRDESPEVKKYYDDQAELKKKEHAEMYPDYQFSPAPARRRRSNLGRPAQSDVVRDRTRSTSLDPQQHSSRRNSDTRRLSYDSSFLTHQPLHLGQYQSNNSPSPTHQHQASYSLLDNHSSWTTPAPSSNRFLNEPSPPPNVTYFNFSHQTWQIPVPEDRRSSVPHDPYQTFTLSSPSANSLPPLSTAPTSPRFEVYQGQDSRSERDRENGFQREIQGEGRERSQNDPHSMGQFQWA